MKKILTSLLALTLLYSAHAMQHIRKAIRPAATHTARTHTVRRGLMTDDFEQVHIDYAEFMKKHNAASTIQNMSPAQQEDLLSDRKMWTAYLMFMGASSILHSRVNSLPESPAALRVLDERIGLHQDQQKK